MTVLVSTVPTPKYCNLICPSNQESTTEINTYDYNVMPTFTNPLHDPANTIENHRLTSILNAVQNVYERANAKDAHEIGDDAVARSALHECLHGESFDPVRSGGVWIMVPEVSIATKKRGHHDNGHYQTSILCTAPRGRRLNIVFIQQYHQNPPK